MTPETAEIDPTVDRPEIVVVQIPPHLADTNATVLQTDLAETIVVRALSAQRATTRVGATHVLTVDRPEIVVARRGMLEIVVRVCLHGLRVPQIAPEFAINDRAVTPISAVVVRGS